MDSAHRHKPKRERDTYDKMQQCPPPSILLLDHLTVDSIDHVSDVLPSFPALRRKTLETLYPSVDPDKKGGSNNNNNNTLTRIDKSPKGSVDAPIQPLVDLLNHHESFATLSSCSGRIAIYDTNYASTTTTTTMTLPEQEQQQPQQQQQQQQEESQRPVEDRLEMDGNDPAAMSNTAAQHHGKGSTGGWLLAAHETIQVDDVMDLLRSYAAVTTGSSRGKPNTTTNESSGNDNDTHDDDDNEAAAIMSSFPTSLALEPMMLHVAASNLTRGRQLLQVALSCGFRESGLVVTDTRVTVAIRSYALAWHMPLLLAPLLSPPPQQRQHGSNHGDDDINGRDDNSNNDYDYYNHYVRRVLGACNARLRQNHAKMHRLYEAVRQALFVERVPTWHVRVTQSLPPLGLWGHAAVVAMNGTGDNNCIYVFGGYGTGPVLAPANDTESSNRSGGQRNPYVYRMRLGENTIHNNISDNTASCVTYQWEQVPVVPPKEESHDDHDEWVYTSMDGVTVKPISWTACQNVRATCIGGDSSLVVLFGGRRSPGQPLGDLILYDTALSIFGIPQHVRGQPPSPRWGHSMTLLPNNRILIMGGRNEETCFSDMHLLSLVKQQEGQNEKDYSETSRSSSCCWQWTEITTLPSPRCFHETVSLPDGRLIVWGGTSDTSVLLPLACYEAWVIDHANNFAISTVPLSAEEKNQTAFIGHSMTCCQHSAGNLSSHVLMLGGTCPQGDENLSDSMIRVISLKQTKDKVFHIEQSTVCRSDTEKESPLNASLLLQHTALMLPSTTETTKSFRVAVIGGGVQGFAFGQLFSKSVILEIEPSYDDSSEQESKTRERRNIPKENVSGRIPKPECKDTANDTRVFYTLKRNAKSLKTQLEEENLIDKTFRMCAVDATQACDLTGDPSEYIAVPVKQKAIALWNESCKGNSEHRSWVRLVAGIGRQPVLMSSGMFARRTKEF